MEKRRFPSARAWPGRPARLAGGRQRGRVRRLVVALARAPRAAAGAPRRAALVALHLERRVRRQHVTLLLRTPTQTSLAPYKHYIRRSPPDLAQYIRTTCELFVSGLSCACCDRRSCRVLVVRGCVFTAAGSGRSTLPTAFVRPSRKTYNITIMLSKLIS